MNGSGRSAMNSTLEKVRSDLGLAKGEAGKIPLTSVHCVTVPGAAAGWVDTVERFGSGKLTLEQILAPAIEMGEKGFPVSEISSAMVCHTSPCLDSLTRGTPVDDWCKKTASSVAKLQGASEGRSRDWQIYRTIRGPAFQESPSCQRLPQTRKRRQKRFLYWTHRRRDRKSRQEPRRLP